jgi:hypothetical protein
MKKYASKLPGPQKFTLLVARLAKGNESVQVPIAEIRKQWMKMRSILGDAYLATYANRSKANGWVDTPKHGTYVLESSWNEAVGQI